MVLTALRGALGFLSRLPVGHSDAAWDAFRATPAAFPLAGYVIGGLLAVPFLAVGTVPPAVVAATYLGAIVVVTGVNHADGLADLGDAAAVHGDPDQRRAVLRDTTVGVGAVLALGTVLAVLALGALAVAGLPVAVAAATVLASEVAAKLAMATLACLGTASHEGYGAAVLADASPRRLLAPVLLAVPAALLSVPVTAVCVLGGLTVGVGLERWADHALGGVSGDVFGAANELARALSLHAAVVTWALIGPEVLVWTRW